MTSYFESWSTFNRNVLPRELHANGAFDGDGYRFWKPQDLGGWAMACGPDQAVALVFGKTNMGDAKYKLQVRLFCESNRLPANKPRATLTPPRADAQKNYDAAATGATLSTGAFNESAASSSCWCVRIFRAF